MRRFIVTYRWELWLFFGMPAVLGAPFYDSRWLWQLFSLSGCESKSCLFGYLAVPLIVGFALLAGSYPFVRRQGREFLALLWTLEIAMSGISLAALGIDLVRGAEWPRGIPLFTLPFFDMSGITFTVSSLARVLVLLWFARRASRMSAGHAFLLVGVSLARPAFTAGLPPFSTLAHYDTGVPFIASFVAAYLALQVSTNLLAFWAMTRFDPGGTVFRRNVIAGLFGMALLSRMWGVATLLSPFALSLEYLLPMLTGNLGRTAAGFALNYLPLLALIYLVRVRQPAPDAKPIPDVPPTPPATDADPAAKPPPALPNEER